MNQMNQIEPIQVKSHQIKSNQYQMQYIYIYTYIYIYRERENNETGEGNSNEKEQEVVRNNAKEDADSRERRK